MDKVWWVRDNKLGIATLSDSTFTTLSTAGDTLRIYYSYTSTDIDALPPQYHDGIVGKALERIFAMKQNFSGAQYYAMQWSDAVRRAKVEANVMKDGALYEIKGHEY